MGIAPLVSSGVAKNLVLFLTPSADPDVITGRPAEGVVDEDQHTA